MSLTHALSQSLDCPYGTVPNLSEYGGCIRATESQEEISVTWFHIRHGNLRASFRGFQPRDSRQPPSQRSLDLALDLRVLLPYNQMILGI